MSTKEDKASSQRNQKLTTKSYTSKPWNKACEIVNPFVHQMEEHH